MELVPHTIAWSRGEIFEGKILLIFGLATLLVAFLFWKVGDTPSSRAMLIPLLVVGLLFSGLATGMILKNQKRIAEYEVEAKADPLGFVQKEKARTENFIGWYPFVRYIAIGVSGLAFALYMFWPEHLLSASVARAVALTLLVLAVTVMFVDHFSEERGRTYYQAILQVRGTF